MVTVPADVETRIRALEARISVLEDIEAIRKLKTKYWRSLDLKQWDELADCYTEDFVFTMNAPGGMKTEGRKEFVEMLKSRFRDSYMMTAHQGHQSNIEITSETSAKGIWTLRDHLVDSQANTVMRGRGYYEDEYAKANAKWQIRSTKLTYLVTEGQKSGYDRELASWPRPEENR